MVVGALVLGGCPSGDGSPPAELADAGTGDMGEASALLQIGAALPDRSEVVALTDRLSIAASKAAIGGSDAVEFGMAAAQLGWDPNPPELILDAPPPVDIGGSVLDAPELGPGDDAIATPDGELIVNPPLPPESGGTSPTGEPRSNPDGSTTYPKGASLPPNAGIPEFHADGSVTVFPYGHGTIDPPSPRGPELKPGDDAVATPDGELIVNPPLPESAGGKS